MAGLWTGTSINTNVASGAFDQLFNLKAIEVVRKKNALFYAILGKPDISDKGKGPVVSYKRLNKVTGDKIRMRYLANAPTPVTVADGSAEIATISPDYDGAMFGALQFDLAHYVHSYAVPSSERIRLAGDEAQTNSYMNDVFRAEMVGWEKEVGTQINSASSAPSRTQMGSWAYAVRNDNTYGVDRTDAGNANFCGVLNSSTGALTLGKIKTARNTCFVNGGNPTVGIAGVTVYGILQSLVEPYSHVTYDENMAQFGSDNVRYSGVTYMLEQYCAAGTMGLIDPESWAFWQNDIGFDASGFARDRNRKAAWVLNWETWIQFLCDNPGWNAQFLAITG